MNKQLLPTLAGLLSLAAPCVAQIPNGGFETWNDAGDYLEPDQWVTSNVVTFSLGGVLSCEQGSPGASGAHFAKVTNQDLGAFGTVPGYIFTGDPTTGTDGFPYALRPAALNGKWQYAQQGSEQGSVSVLLTTWNTTTGSRDQIGLGYATTTGEIDNWQNFTVAISYFSALFPDTASVQILASSANFVAGCSIWVDDLSLGAPTGVAEQVALPEFNLYPSPATGLLYITTTDRLAEVSVQDITGRELIQAMPAEVPAAVDVSRLPPGIYTARVRSTDGRIEARRFMKN